jgi:hypothetical protein
MAYIFSKEKVKPTPVTARVGFAGEIDDTEPSAGGHGWWGVIAAGLLFLFLVPGFLANFLSTRMQLSAHGYLHSAYTYQILNGHTPPENVLFPGYLANFYWPYHALIATFSQVLNSPPPLMGTVLSVIALALALGLLYELVETLLVCEKRPLVLTILAFFSLFGANLFGTLHSAARLSPGSQTLQENIADLFPQALFGDGRLTIPLVKYLGFDGVPLGWLMYIFVLLIVIKGLSGKIRGTDVVLACLATFAALALHAMEGIFIVLAVPAALAATYVLVALLEGKLFSGAYHRQKVSGLTNHIIAHWQWSLAVFALLIVVGLATLRFLLGAAGSGGTAFAVDLISLDGLESIFSMTYPLIPFFLLAVYHAYRSVDRRMIFLVVLTAVGMAMGYGLRVSNNEYKFIYCAAIAMSILCTGPIWHYVFRPTTERHPWGKALGLFMLALMFVNVLIAGVSHLAQPWVTADNFVANGVHVDSRTAYAGIPFPEPTFDWTRNENGDLYPDDLQYADVFQWVRGNTPTDAVLVVPMIHKDTSTLFLLSERVPYVIDGEIHNQTIPEHGSRVAQVDEIFDSERSAGNPALALDGIRANLVGREKYLVYPLSNTELSSDPARYGLERVYEGRYANLFRILSE